MKRATLVVLAAAGLAALPVASCSVHRVSDAFACDPAGNGGECQGGRVCRQGFCVEDDGADACPDPCTSCDVGDRTCQIDCTDGTACARVQCPAGYDCTIRCSGGGTCGDVDCAQAHSCDITCGGPSACGNLNCGPGECTIRCFGSLACPRIDCAASCGCDVSCNNPASCPSMACREGGLGPCTEDGSAGAPCTSDPPGCDVCS